MGIACDESAVEEEVAVMKSGGRRRKLTAEDHRRHLEELERSAEADEH